MFRYFFPLPVVWRWPCHAMIVLSVLFLQVLFTTIVNTKKVSPRCHNINEYQAFASRDRWKCPQCIEYDPTKDVSFSVKSRDMSSR